MRVVEVIYTNQSKHACFIYSECGCCAPCFEYNGMWIEWNSGETSHFHKYKLMATAYTDVSLRVSENDGEYSHQSSCPNKPSRLIPCFCLVYVLAASKVIGYRLVHSWQVYVSGRPGHWHHEPISQSVTYPLNAIRRITKTK